MSRIDLTNVSKEFPGGVVAVDDVSLEIRDGEFISFVGPSGCGKTTTLRVVAGFERPTDGSVHIGEEDVTDLPPYRRDTGMVFQNFALFPHMTVAENVAYGLEVGGDHSKDEIADRVEEMLELVRLPDVGDRMPGQLSGGQQQRIALARAIAPEPKVLLLDEPLASLDKKLRERMQVELRQIQRDVGITTIFVTHNQQEALTMSDRVVVMNDGRIEQVGDPATVYGAPANRFVADFVGTANFFEGTVSSVDADGATVDCGSVSLTVEDTWMDVGDEVTVVVRPEDVALDGDGPNRIDAALDIKRLLGSVTEYRFATDDHPDLVAVGKDRPVDVGDGVTVTIPPESCYVLEGSA